MSSRSMLLVAAAAIAYGEPLRGQIFQSAPEERHTEHRLLFDLAPQYLRPVGEFRRNVDDAWGGGVSVRYSHDKLGPLGVRLDGAMLIYGHERKRVPLSPEVNRVLVDVNTSNNIGLFTAGPELIARRGAIRPYVFAYGGISYLLTESSVGDDDDGDGGFASTTHLYDGGWATGWGGGLRVPIRLRHEDIGIDVGARMTRNGTRNYLRRGDIIDLPDGSLQLNERRTSVDFIQYQIAVSFGPIRSRSR